MKQDYAFPHRKPHHPSSSKKPVLFRVTLLVVLVQILLPNFLFGKIPSEFFENVDTLLRNEMDKQDIPGAAIVLFNNKQVVWSAEFGWTDRSHSKPITPDTIFSAQSTSKLVTALALLHAREKGLLNLEAPISRYLPELTLNSAWEKDPHKVITVRQLLNHTSGLPHEARINNNYSLDYGSFDQHLESIAFNWLKFPAGTRQCYSNLGYSLAGRILENASGISYESYVEKHILAPIGIERGTVRRNAALADCKRARGHSRQFENVPECPDIPSAGGLYATAGDLARLFQLLMNEGKTSSRQQLLTAESCRQLHRLPFTSSGQVYGHGLGLEWKKEGSLKYCIAPGRGFGFIGGVAWIPEANLGLAMLFNNQDAFLPYQLLGVFLEFAGKQIDTASPAESIIAVSSQLPASGLAGITGEYIGDEGRLYLSRDGEDFFLDPGDGNDPLPVYAADSGRIVLKTSTDHSDLKYVHDLGTNLPALVDIGSGKAYFANTRRDSVNPASKNWGKHVGRYDLRRWGKVISSHQFRIVEGMPFWDDLCLYEHQPGLYFTPVGEALDLRGPVAYLSGIRLEFHPE